MNLIFIAGLACLAVALIKQVGLIISGIVLIVVAILIELW
jgi:hypothetical protein